MTVSAAEANRSFSAVLKQVKGGRSVTITSHGQPVARMVPVRSGDNVTTAARRALLLRLKTARIQRVGTWTRDELHEEPR